MRQLTIWLSCLKIFLDYTQIVKGSLIIQLYLGYCCNFQSIILMYWSMRRCWYWQLSLILTAKTLCQIIINTHQLQMNTKLVTREIINIIGNYLYNRPFKSLNEDSVQVKNNPQFDLKNIYRPLDLYLRTYFTSHKYIGSSERSAISDKVYNLIRYEYLLSHLIRSKPFDIQKEYHFNQEMEKQIQYKINTLFSAQFYTAIDNPTLPKFLRVSQNKLLFKELSLSLLKDQFIYQHSAIVDKKKTYQLGDQESAFDVSYIMNSRAPLTIRVNPLKTTKHQLVQKLQKKFKLRLQKCQYVPFGFKIVAPKNVNLLQTEEFQQGFFQIQDQGSQIAALRAQVKPGELVLDYCGGSGGKSLAIAHLLQQKGQIFVHEPRQVALGKAKRRFARAGITNVQFHNNQQSLNKIALGKMDWVIVDAPCTGTGTLRRNPDIKLKFTEDTIKKNVILQQQIVSKAIKFLKKNGKILYITCSLLKQQNEQQIKHFTKIHNLQVVNGQVLKILPQKDGSDGFFAVVLQRIK